MRLRFEDGPAGYLEQRDTLKLSQLRKGDRAMVVGVADSDGQDSGMKRRLLELGFVAGEFIHVVAESFPGRDPIAVRLGNTTFALRRYEAALIHVVRGNGEAA